jgi:hypothetical protein
MTSCHISGCGSLEAADMAAGLAGGARCGVSPAVWSAVTATIAKLGRKIEANITQLLHMVARSKSASLCGYEYNFLV